MISLPVLTELLVPKLNATAVTVGVGLFALASAANGTLALSLTGTESRAALKLTDSNGAVRSVTSSTAGVLEFAGAAYAKDADVTTAFAGVTTELAEKISKPQLETATGTSGLRLRFSEHNVQVDTNITKLSLWEIVRSSLGNQIKCATCVSILSNICVPVFSSS